MCVLILNDLAHIHMFAVGPKHVETGKATVWVVKSRLEPFLTFLCTLVIGDWRKTRAWIDLPIPTSIVSDEHIMIALGPPGHP